MSNESTKIKVNDSMKPTISNESAKSGTPNTTKPIQTKPAFTPPPQNTSKNTEN